MSNTRGRTDWIEGRLSGISLAWVLCFFATLVAAPARADTTVQVESASLALDEDVYALDADLEIVLQDEARRAIESGLTLRLNYQVYGARAFEFQVRMKDWQISGSPLESGGGVRNATPNTLFSSSLTSDKSLAPVLTCR